MSPYRFARPAMVAMLTCIVCSTSSCGIDDADEITDDWMHGTMMGASWTAGPGAVTIHADGSTVIRIFEKGSPPDACSLDPTFGRRIEILMARLQTGYYDAASNPGYAVEAWDGKQGLQDPYSAMQIDDARSELGASVIGRARFGTSASGENVEGRFEAVVCAIE